MTFDPRRRLGALRWRAAVVLLLCAVVGSVAPAFAAAADAPAPKIVSVDVTGNLRVPTPTIMSVIAARPGQPYNPKVVQDDLARINALGYFADIAPPLVRARPNGIAITYRVVENPVITKIVFTGNQKVPSDTLTALMDLSVGQVFNTNTFRQDVLKINNYYERIGYGGQVPTHVKDINLDPKTGVLALKIQEGLVVTSIDIGGDPILPPVLILPHLTLKVGGVYSDAVRDADYKALQKLYENTYHLELGNFEGGIVPSTIDLKAGTADVKYNIYVARIAVVEITGNTRTKDNVIRRELREHPGMVLNTDAIKRDYERLNALNFFSKVEPDVQPGPDPKKPQDVTLVWHVTEQRTASASVGFGYSGGLTGQGLYGTLGLSDNNLHGTGNSAGIQFEDGARTGLAQLTLSVPYLGNTPKGQRYTAGGSLFTNHSTYYYPIYSIAGSGIGIASNGSVPIPVTLYPSSSSQQISNIVATNSSSATGATANVGRRMSDYTILSLSLNAQRIRYDTTVPSPYYFQGNQPNIFVGPTPGPLNSSTNQYGGSFGIAASSIANVNTGAPYNLITTGLSLQTITLDDPFNPREGVNALLNAQLSNPALGSNFPIHAGHARHREVLPGASRCDAGRPRCGLLLDRRHSAERALYVLRSADARVQPGLLCDQRLPRTDRAPTTPRDRPPNNARGLRRRAQLPYPRCVPPARSVHQPNHRLSGRLGALRRRRLRGAVRRAAARPAHGPHRLCQGTLRHAHELWNRAEFLARNAKRTI